MFSITLNLEGVGDRRYLAAVSREGLPPEQIYQRLAALDADGSLAGWIGCASCLANLETGLLVHHPGVQDAGSQIRVPCPVLMRRHSAKEKCANGTFILFENPPNTQIVDSAA